MARLAVLLAVALAGVAPSALSAPARTTSCASVDPGSKVTGYNPPAVISCNSAVVTGDRLYQTETVSSGSSSSAGMLEFTDTQLPDCYEISGASDQIAPSGYALAHQAGITFCTLLKTSRPIQVAGASVATVSAVTTKATSVKIETDSNGKITVSVPANDGTVSVKTASGMKNVPGGMEDTVSATGHQTIGTYTPSPADQTIITELENDVIGASASQLGFQLETSKQTSVVLVGTDTQELAREAQLLASDGIHVQRAPASVTTNVQSLALTYNKFGSAAHPAIVVVGSLPSAGSAFFQSLNAARTVNTGPVGAAKLALPSQTQIFWIAPTTSSALAG